MKQKQEALNEIYEVRHFQLIFFGCSVTGSRWFWLDS